MTTRATPTVHTHTRAWAGPAVPCTHALTFMRLLRRNGLCTKPLVQNTDHLRAQVQHDEGHHKQSDANTNTNTKYTCDTGQTRNKLLAQLVHLTNHAAGLGQGCPRQLDPVGLLQRPLRLPSRMRLVSHARPMTLPSRSLSEHHAQQCLQAAPRVAQRTRPWIPQIPHSTHNQHKKNAQNVTPHSGHGTTSLGTALSKENNLLVLDSSCS